MRDNDKYQIEISPQPHYLPEQSDPEENRYVFAYTITIRNRGRLATQLLSRHWIITDARNEVQEVRGQGVVGKQPLLQPGESFTYTSGTPLEAVPGTMKGSYRMRAADGHEFDAEIPEFLLAPPGSLH